MRIMVYKPQGWPEYWTPQYPGGSKLILAENGYWSPMRWDTYVDCDFEHEHWKKRILHTHWKARDHDPDTYIFTEGLSVNPDYSGLQWNTYDWAPVHRLVDKADELMQKGDYANRDEVWKTHELLIHWIGKDDRYWNKWYTAMRRFDWLTSRPDVQQKK